MTAASLDLTIEKEGIGGVVGLAPTVALRNAATLNSYFDWADSTFKTSGWTTKYAAMTAVERGHYRRALDLSTTPSIIEGMALVAEYHVDNGSGIIGDAHDIITVADAAAIAAAVWDAQLADHLDAGTTGEALANAGNDVVRATGIPP
jgi:hypothetical protein